MASAALRPIPVGPGKSGNALQLILATGAFSVCFAVFGSISAMMPIMRRNLHLTSLQVSVALALPVLLGSLGRIPLGMLSDRYGGRLVFSLVMAFLLIPAWLVGTASGFPQFLIFLAGMGLASFSVGAGFVSAWYPPNRQGTALGVYGAGSIGQSAAAFFAPSIAAAFGLVWGYRVFALVVFAWLVLFVLFSRNAPRPTSAKSLREMARPLRQPESWMLSLYYFLTFGGLVAMAVYLPILLTELFALTPQDAGRRTAGFVLFATIARPIGGTFADRIGGQAILKMVFPFVAVMAGLLTIHSMIPFTIGALGMAAAIGLGNGAVFKLLPQYFPQCVGTVTGLVGAAGGLGGFFPPLVLGLVRQSTGTYTLGFWLLGLFALVCLTVLLLTAGREQAKEVHARAKAAS